MKNEINAVLENMTTTIPEPEDYTGEDGLLYCGKCRSRKKPILRRIRRYLRARPPPGRVRLPENRPRGTGSRRKAAQTP